MSSSVIHSNASSFKSDVLDHKGLVMAYFWAPWCGPCKALAPHLEVLATEMAGKVKICKIDIDDEGNGNLAIEHNIRAVPTIIFFKNGQQVDTITGADLEKINRTIGKHMNQ